ncbi:MAG: TIGR02594 family protein [Pseudomonadota bacterium]
MAYSDNDKLAFIGRLYCPARAVADETGCSWELILAQAAQETGWGERVLPGTNNVFNIKADKSWKGETKTFHVKEYDEHKRPFYMDSPFRVYPSYLNSLRDRMAFLKSNPRYHKLNDADIKGNLEKEAHALQAAKYALDPDYANALVRVARGPMMRRALAKAKLAGCAGTLPVIEVFLKDGAKVAIANTKVTISHAGRSASAVTDAHGSLAIKITATSTGVVQLKLYDDFKRVWIDVAPVTIPSPVKSITVTLVAPTFTIHTSTRVHDKDAAPASHGAAAHAGGGTAAPKSSAPILAKAGGGAPKSGAGTSAATQAGTHGASHGGAAGTHAGSAGATAHHQGGTTRTKPYKIEKGDTLAKIAATFKMRYKTIADLNGIASPYIIRPDQILQIPVMEEAGHAAGGTKEHATHAPAHTTTAHHTGTHMGTHTAGGHGVAQHGAAHPTATHGGGAHGAGGHGTNGHAAQGGTHKPAAGFPSNGQQSGSMFSDFLTSLHAAYYRDESNKPKTEVMPAMKAPWMKFAEEEFKAKVKRVAGTGVNSHITEYFTATSYNNHKAIADDETAWCAAFCNWCLVKAGFKGDNSARAADFKTWGRATKDNKPALGAVAVIKFSDGSHHVTFVAGLTKDGNRLATLGGNQGDNHGVTHSHIGVGSVVCYRYPSDYADYPEDYILHDVKSDGAALTAAGTH